MTNSSNENQRSTNEKINGPEGKSKTKPIIHPQRRKLNANTFRNSKEENIKKLQRKTQKYAARETKQLSNDPERKWFSVCNDRDRNDKFLRWKPKDRSMRKPTDRKENYRQNQLSIRNDGKPNHRSVRNGGKPNQILPIQACFKCIQRQRESLIIQWITSSAKRRNQTSGKSI